jgi:fructose-1,6-bisphosphatase
MLQEAEKLDVEVNEALQNMLAWQEIMRQKISERDACLVAAKKFSHYVVDPN